MNRSLDHRIASVLGAWMAIGCASAPSPRAREAPEQPPPPLPERAAAMPKPERKVAVDLNRLRERLESPVLRGELPWWHSLTDGIYRLGPEVVVVALGDSGDHQHAQEGFLQSKVSARLAVRKASESIRFKGSIPEPTLEDLFITRDRRFLALYMIRVPQNAVLPPSVKEISTPELLRKEGRRRVGRHVFEGTRHLFLECDVEGPIANPDWGRTRASARVDTGARAGPSGPLSAPGDNGRGDDPRPPHGARAGPSGPLSAPG